MGANRTEHKQHHIESTECYSKGASTLFCNLGVPTNFGLNILISIHGLAGTSNLYLVVYYVYLLMSSCILNCDTFYRPMGHLEYITLEVTVLEDSGGLENATPIMKRFRKWSNIWGFGKIPENQGNEGGGNILIYFQETATEQGN